MKYYKYFSLKMNREKSVFHFEKYNLEPIGNTGHTTEYLAFGKDLLARLYLKVKVYITKLLGVYIICKKSHPLNEVILFGFLHFWGFLWPWKLTSIEHWINFNCPIFFPWWLKLCFLTRYLSIFTTIDEKRLFLIIFKYFWRMLLRKKIWEILKKGNSWKSNYLTNYFQSKPTFWAKLIKNHIQ